MYPPVLPGFTGGSLGTTIPIESREIMLSASDTTPPMPGIGCGSIAPFSFRKFYAPDVLARFNAVHPKPVPLWHCPDYPPKPLESGPFSSPCWMPITSPFLADVIDAGYASAGPGDVDGGELGSRMAVRRYPSPKYGWRARSATGHRCGRPMWS